MIESEDHHSSDRDWERLWKTFHQARSYTIPSERNAYLNQIADSDADLCVHLKELLAADEVGTRFLEDLIEEELNLLQPPVVEEDSNLQPGDLLAQRFRIIRQIGKGGMGTVYEAFDQELSISVALKMMRGEHSLDQHGRERFYREIHVARQITHPNACRIFDLFRDGDLLFLTMELLEGVTLHEKIRQEVRLTLDDTIPIVLQIVEALSAIHESGIIHRDFKSSNILLVQHDKGVRAVVTDFGLATTFASRGTLQVTQTGLVLGTPEFMSPEQLSNGPMTPATDVYALGLVLHEMLTGELPLAGESPLTIAARRMNENAPSPRRLVPDLNRKWERIILRCLERNARHRFQNAREVLEAIHDNSSFQNLLLMPVRYRSKIFTITAALIFMLIAAVFVSRTGMLDREDSGQELQVKRVLTGATGLPPGLLSTDGKILIDVDWQTADLIATQLSSGRKRRITHSGSWFYPQKYTPYPVVTSLSRDSKRVAYSFQHEWDSGCDLKVVEIVGSRITTLYSNKKSCNDPFDWTPDNQKILTLNRHPNGTGEICLISANDKSMRVFKSIESADIRKMSLSPDGRYVVYDQIQSKNSANRDLFILNLQDKAENRLVNHQANDYFLGWTPDGSKILFASDRSGTEDAWALPIRNGKTERAPERIRKDIGQIFPLKLTSDGSLYYSHLLTSKDVYTMALNSDGTRVVSPPTKIAQGFSGSNDAPEFSPDGDSMIFQATANPILTSWFPNQPNILKLLMLRTNEVVDFSHQAEGISGKARWSPDGQSILFSIHSHKNGPGVYRLDLNSGTWTRILSSEKKQLRQFFWGQDGTSVFFLHNKEGNVLLKDLASGHIQHLCSDASDFSVSRDGRWIAFISIDISKGETVLKTMPAKGGSQREILKLSQPYWISNFVFSSDSRYLFFTKGRRDRIDDPHQLWKIPIEGGKQYDLGAGTESVLDVRVHPDGKRLAIWSVLDTSEVWVMRNFLPE